MQRTRPFPVILIVEDFADTRNMLKLLLESSDYTALTAGNGKDALSIAPDRHIDLILTDFNLPDMTGATLVRQLRQLNQDLERIPIVMITAVDAEEYRDLAVEAGCNEFIVKPLDLDSLETIFDSLLSARPIGVSN